MKLGRLIKPGVTLGVRSSGAALLRGVEQPTLSD
jgi:hypothetical protein